MKKKQAIFSFITGTLIFFLVYSGIQYFFFDKEVSFIENLFVATLWSAGMLAFDVWWRKKKQKAQ